jgi:hypothetical protein
VKLFRADQKTCGCPKSGAAPKVDPLEGKYFVGPKGQADGKIIARVSGSQYLVRLGGDDGGVEQLVPTASMNLWLFGDSSWHAVETTLREMGMGDSEL